jgi:3-methyladenine DNA glycosylase AlkC
MGDLLKDLYSPAFYKKLTKTLTAVLPTFNQQRFISRIFTDDFPDKELKARMRHTTMVLHQFMPSSFTESADILVNLATQLKKQGIGEDSLVYMFIPDYIEVYGLDDLETSVQAMEIITQFVSCEFGVRSFLLKYEKQMISQMEAWSKHGDHKVRRLASEGSRTRLPWAMAVPFLKKDPSPILPILENLKNDPSEWVRRSVANSLNDIAKDHPEVVVSIARKWKGISRETDAIIKHGSRTLLKRGHIEMLKYYGLNSKKILVSAFKITTPVVKMGDSLHFSFRVTNQDVTKQKIRLEYGLYYRKANNQLTKKVFKISESMLKPGSEKNIQREQSFRKITTRVFYPGEHHLSVIVNGAETAAKVFTLRKK